MHSATMREGPHSICGMGETQRVFGMVQQRVTPRVHQPDAQVLMLPFLGPVTPEKQAPSP